MTRSGGTPTDEREGGHIVNGVRKLEGYVRRSGRTALVKDIGSETSGGNHTDRGSLRKEPSRRPVPRSSEVDDVRPHQRV